MPPPPAAVDHDLPVDLPNVSSLKLHDLPKFTNHHDTPDSHAPVRPLHRRSISFSRDAKPARAMDAHLNSSGSSKRERRPTNPADVEEKISRPGAVRINVTGAFIVDNDEGSRTPSASEGEETGSPIESGTRDIRLPNHVGAVSHIAVDIGGSLAKLVYFSREPHEDLGGRLSFLKFETDRIDDCIAFMRRLQAEHHAQAPPGSPPLCVMATGGGAFKYYDKIRQALDVEVLREDEMECLIIGLDFFITEIPCEVFTHSEADPMRFVEPQADIYPYLLVNIGSGVSMVKVSGPRQYERIGGTSLGGGTLWGLLSLLTGARDFGEMLALAEGGDNTAVDMLVGDIYGMNYDKIGLKSTAIASSFGKVYKMKRQAEREAEDNGGLANGDDIEGGHDDLRDGILHRRGSQGFRPEDVSRSLLYAVSNNIGQIAYLHAEKHGLERIYFGGSFIGGYAQTMNTLAYAIRFWSKGSKQAYFLRHEGYLGSVGAFLKRHPKNWGRRNSLEGMRGLVRSMSKE